MIHYSLFPNENCIICKCKVKNNALHCVKCFKKWLELTEKQNPNLNLKEKDKKK
jgi:hypothetical protein